MPSSPREPRCAGPWRPPRSAPRSSCRRYLKAWLALLLPETGRWKEQHAAEKQAVLRMECQIPHTTPNTMLANTQLRIWSSRGRAKPRQPSSSPSGPGSFKNIRPTMEGSSFPPTLWTCRTICCPSGPRSGICHQCAASGVPLDKLSNSWAMTMSIGKPRNIIAYQCRPNRHWISRPMSAPTPRNPCDASVMASAEMVGE